MKVFYDLKALNKGNTKRISLDFERYAHMIIVGGSGSGKTIALKLILGKISRYMPNTEMFIADFKNDKDFEFLRGNERFYGFADMAKGIEDFYERFEARLKGEDEERHHIFLVLDEYAAFLNYLGGDKKNKENIELQKKMLMYMGNLMMMARSYNCHIIVALQRADADYFSKGARDNFTLRLGLGKLSTELKTMIFEDGKQDIVSLGRGKGYLDVDGKPLQVIVVPHISSMDPIDEDILKAIKRGVVYSE
ncbi:hypothetical protein CN372_26095 [Bacillus anthracis]|nr:hypothetical protein CN372_26095 [Bacillus anthracis]